MEEFMDFADDDEPLNRSAHQLAHLAANASTPPTNCSNDYCVSDEDYIAMIEEHIFPMPYEWALIALHTVVFIIGLLGNVLVCMAVYQNQSMRTVTNIYIVNLACADFMVIFFCLPPTVIWDVTETWFLGGALCKIILFLQDLSVTVSVLTLTFISVDRWYAVCSPLKFASSTRRAVKSIAVIWTVSSVSVMPNLFVLKASPRQDLKVDTILLTTCEATWGRHSELTYMLLKAVFLYMIPLFFMSVAYYQIVKVLWSQEIPGHNESSYHPARQSSVTCARSTSYRRGQPRAHGNQEGNHLDVRCNGDEEASDANRREAVRLNASARSSRIEPCESMQLRSRRKAAKMLVAVVVMFAICFFPVHLISVLRYWMDIPQNDLTVGFMLVSHWLCYANSAVNPVIYNFMSARFRRALLRACKSMLNRPVESDELPLPARNHSGKISPYQLTRKTGRDVSPMTRLAVPRPTMPSTRSSRTRIARV